MSRLPGAASPALDSLFDEIEATPGRLYSVDHFRSMAVRPDLLVAVWNLVKLLATSGVLPTSFVRAVVASIPQGSRSEPGCATGVDESRSSGMGSPQCDELNRAVISMVGRVAAKPAITTDADIAELQDLGATTEELVEVAIVIALTRLMRTWAGAVKIEGDDRDKVGAAQCLG